MEISDDEESAAPPFCFCSVTTGGLGMVMWKSARPAPSPSSSTAGADDGQSASTKSVRCDPTGR